jgi:hypothetical protein
LDGVVVASLEPLAPGVVSLCAFLSFFAFLVFFFSSPLAPLVDSVPDAPEVADDFLSELAPEVPPVDDAPDVLSFSEAPELAPGLLVPDAPELLVPDAPDAPPMLPLSDELGLALGLEDEPAVPAVPDAPDDVASLLLGVDPDEPVGLPACAVGLDALPLVFESAPALRPVPCASATEDTDAISTNDKD